MIHLIQHAALRIGVFQQRFAKGMKGLEGDVLGAFSDRSHDTRFHFAGGFIRECQAENVFARQARIRLQQVPNSLGDDARLSRARAGYDCGVTR